VASLTPEQLTARYRDFGLPATIDRAVREAWESHLAGQGAPLRLLPTNGATCAEMCRGGVACGYPILIDGTCPNVNDHGVPDLPEYQDGDLWPTDQPGAEGASLEMICWCGSTCLQSNDGSYRCETCGRSFDHQGRRIIDVENDVDEDGELLPISPELGD
jgi:hypothetical protein